MNRSSPHERQTSGWARTNTITASDGATGDNFGFAVAIDGYFIVVGAHQDDDSGSASGSAYVYERNPGTRMVTQRARLLASDGATGDAFGSSVAIDGEWIIVGAQLHEHGGTKVDSGAAYIFAPSGAAWVEAGEIRDTFRTKEDNSAGAWMCGAIASSSAFAATTASLRRREKISARHASSSRGAGFEPPD